MSRSRDIAGSQKARHTHTHPDNFLGHFLFKLDFVITRKLPLRGSKNTENIEINKD